MSLIGTRTKKHNVLRNESGQGALEYILLLLIAVIIIGSAIFQFSTAFRSYANNYFGEYIACLLETGELPGQTAGQCTDGWKDFKLADGKTAIGGFGGGGNGGNGGSGSGGGSKGDTSNSPGGKKGSGSSKPSSSSSSKGSGETVGVSAGESGSSGRTKAGTRKTTSVASASSQDSGAGRERLKAVGSVSTSGTDDPGGRGKRTSLSSSFGYAGQKEENDRALERPVSQKVGEDDSGRLKPKSVAQQMNRAPAATDDSGSEFTIGNFIRILLIAGILIAIFILFGGQLLAISKGGEK
jgi:hypothetical protein